MAGFALNFTKKALEALPPPVRGCEYHRDTKTAGLALRVSAGGTKAFVLYRKINGKPERVTIGRFPDLTIEQARGKAEGLNNLIAQGVNPADKVRVDKAELTFGQLFQEYMERHAKVHKKSWAGDQAQFDRYLTGWQGRKVSTLARADVQKLHAALGRERGKYAANRVLALLSTLFGKAIDWGMLDGPNPAVGVTRFKEQSRARFLAGDELPRFFQALAEEPNATIRDYILVSLLTGARKANVLAMRWDEINFGTATWTIPETKTGDSLAVPLAGPAMVILLERRATAANQWVFPGSGRTGHLVEPKTAWGRILARAGIDGLRIHDLRRSLGSWQAATGANLSIIGKTLGHRNVSTTAIYARLNLDPVRQAVEIATAAIWQAGGLLPMGEVEVPQEREERFPEREPS